MEIRKFRSNYGLELITASHAGISLGDLVWDALSGKVSFSHPGMPNTIYSAFMDAGLIDEEESIFSGVKLVNHFAVIQPAGKYLYPVADDYLRRFTFNLI